MNPPPPHPSLPGTGATPTLACEAVPGDPRFQALASLPGIAVDLRYPTADNFAGRVLYSGLDCAWLRAEAAEGLLQASTWLQAQHPGWRLVVLDALRPQRVQEQLWAQLAGSGLERYLAHPERGSIHSFGMAVDVNLLDPQGHLCDMGSGFDELHPRSHPALEDQHLAQGVLMQHHVGLRQRLRQAMAAGGFEGISTEWWHFDHGDRAAVRQRGPRVL